MQTQVFADPFAFLYNTPGDYFPGYRAEAAFQHGEPVVVARIEAAGPEGYSSVMTETRMPANFFKAVISDKTGPLVRFSTGSGPEMAELLHTLCTAFANGTVRLTPSPRLRHTLGMGQGWSRVMLCFADPVLASTIGAQLQSEMMTVAKVQ